MKNTRKPNHKFEFNKLTSTEEKRQYALSVITDEKWLRPLRFESISLSTIEIAMKVFLGETVKFAPPKLSRFKDHGEHY
jgi:hypothetical protein